MVEGFEEQSDLNDRLIVEAEGVEDGKDGDFQQREEEEEEEEEEERELADM